MFDAWGRTVYRYRWMALTLSAILLAASVALLARGGTLLSYQTPESTESGEGARLVEEQLGASEATFLVVLSHPTLRWDDPAFRSAVEAALAPVESDPLVDDVRTAYDVPAGSAGALVSRDGHRILATVTMAGELTKARDAFPEIRAKLQSATLDVKTTDRVAVYAEIEAFLAKDLARAEAGALPAVLILLIVAFGSVVAALLPLGVGLLAVAGGIAGVLVASSFTDMSVYAMNIVTLIGLGVAIDYSLFVVSRFREELHARGLTANLREPRERIDAGVRDALAATMATAGRATAFSGLTVAVGLAGLAFYRGLFFASIGIAGAIVVGLAVLYALTFLAAILAILGPRVDLLRVPTPKSRRPRDFWGRLARGVMARPLLFLLPTLTLVLLAGSPFLRLEMGSGGIEALPEEAESRQAWTILRNDFPGTGRNVVSVVLQQPGDPLTRERIGQLYDLSRELARLPGVTGVESVVDLDPRFDRARYQDLLSQPRASLPPAIQEAVNATIGRDVAVLAVRSDTGESTPEARALVEQIRALAAPPGARLLVTGPTAIDADTIELTYRYTPAAVAFVVATTYVLLLVQTGSVILPLKAIVMNFLSIAASFGALVWIFQEGNLSAILGFTPAPIDPSLPVLLFCIVFGLSMDYEVLLLSRMHEEWDRTHDNAAAVAGGLAKSGRLITSAAGIMIVVFGAFAFAQVTIIQAIGLGLALAIAIDATLVRALVVPSTMRLMGDLNWWAPAWLARLLKPLGH